jgi:predicted deacylase
MTQPLPEKYFSADYETSRDRFVSAAMKAGGVLTQLPSHTDESGRKLFTDIAWFGNPAPEKVLMVLSGVHGVEGFAGSAIQLAAIEALETLPAESAVVMVHALNAYGMANLRRFNRNNVDLNRNFHFSENDWDVESKVYASLDPFFNPQRPPRKLDAFYLRALITRLRFGMPHVRQALTGGQHCHPKGLYYGGKGLEPEAANYIDWLQQSGLLQVKKLMVLDLHTGLGQYGEQSLFMRSDASTREELSEKLGIEVTPSKTESATMGYSHGGGNSGVYRKLFQGKHLACLTVEYGTYKGLKMLHAMRAENQHHNYGDRSIAHWSKKNLKEVFCPDSEKWQREIVSQAIDLIDRGKNWLSVNPQE